MISNIQELPRAIAARIPADPSRAPHDGNADESLIGRIALGDATAMRTLFVRHSTRVYRYIVSLTGNATIAEDVVNEVFLQVWRKAGQFQGRSQVSTWLLAVARNQALRELRRQSVEPLDDKHEMVEDASDSPETTMHRKQSDTILFNCLKQLSPVHREVIDLVYYHGKTVSDAALITGVAENTVKTRMFYARKRLSELLKAAGIDRGWP